MAFGLESLFSAVAGPLIGGLFGAEESSANRAAAAEANAANAAASEANNLRNIAFQEAANAQNIALSRETQSRNEALAREMAAQNEALQREFAQMGIRWRVEDAKAAGLHPLFALSGGGAAYSPSPAIIHSAPSVQAPQTSPPPSRMVYSSNVMGEMGQNLGRALSAALDPVQQAERALQLRLLEASVDKEQAMAAYYRSGGNGGNSSVGIPVSGGGNPDQWVIDLPFLMDTVRAKPAEQVSALSSDRSTEAHVGGNPMFSEFVGPYGWPLMGLSEKASDSFEGAGELAAAVMALPSVVLKNIERSGQEVANRRLLDRAFDWLLSPIKWTKEFSSKIPPVTSTLQQYGGPNPWVPKRYRRSR